MNINRYRILFGIKIVVFSIMSLSAQQNSSRYFEISKNLELFAEVYKQLNTHYVDELEPGPLMEKAIDAMMESLDPYTVYYSESEIEGYRFDSEANIKGIGAEFVKISDQFYVRNVQEFGSAYKNGLRSGDRLISIEGKELSGKSLDALYRAIEGFEGTTVSMEVQNAISSEKKTLDIERGETEIRNVPHYELLNNQYAYAYLSTFTRDAARNVRKAYDDLRKDGNVEGYILDLRGNGGGLLAEAVSLCNLFLPKDVLVVTTKSKLIDWDQSYSTRGTPMDDTLPLIVLVDGHSASASEIVSGTIQDYDRGVVLGNRTYGKGLVQRTEDVGYNSKIKLTISEYYIPSGRCIQAVRYDDAGKPVVIPETDRGNYKTKNGRIVQDGGGVLPDIIMPPQADPFTIEVLENNHIIFQFVNDYLRSSTDSIPLNYTFTDMPAFYRYIENERGLLQSELTQGLENLVKKAKDKAQGQLVSQLDNAITLHKSQLIDQMKKNETAIKSLIEKEMIQRKHFKKGAIIKDLQDDPLVQKAIKMLNNPVAYKETLNP